MCENARLGTKVPHNEALPPLRGDFPQARVWHFPVRLTGLAGSPARAPMGVLVKGSATSARLKNAASCRGKPGTAHEDGVPPTQVAPRGTLVASPEISPE